MSNPKVLGTCVCPMCREAGAEVREDTRGVPYIICDGCNTMIRTQSRRGKAAIRALVQPAPDAKAAPGGKDGVRESEPAPALPAATEKRRKFGFA